MVKLSSGYFFSMSKMKDFFNIQLATTSARGNAVIAIHLNKANVKELIKELEEVIK